MDLTSLKLSKKSLKKGLEASPSSPDEPYPWGTRVTLEKDAMANLPGVDDLQVGDVVTIEARAVVVAREESAAAGAGARKSMTLQLTHIGVESMDDASAGFRDGAKDG